MLEIPSPILTVLITSGVAALLSAITLILAKRSGLGSLQVAVSQETDKLVRAQKERIELLEATVEELTKRVQALEEESKKDKKEINRLRKVIADRAIEEL